MEKNSKRKGKVSLPVWKKTGGIIFLIVILVTSVLVTFFIFDKLIPGKPEVDRQEAGPPFILWIILPIIGGFFFFMGLFMYFLVTITDCFTSDFSGNVFAKLKKKIYGFNLVVQILFIISICPILGVVFTPFFKAIGLPAAEMISFLFFLILIQFIFLMVNIWVPLEKRLIMRIMTSRGFKKGDLKSGIYMGISDPSKTSFKKMYCVEDDIGMMFIHDDRLTFQGGATALDVRRDQIVDIVMDADAGGVAAYFGISNILVRYQEAADQFKTVRLHPEGFLTIFSLKKYNNQLEDQLSKWKDQK